MSLEYDSSLRLQDFEYLHMNLSLFVPVQPNLLFHQCLILQLFHSHHLSRDSNILITKVNGLLIDYVITKDQLTMSQYHQVEYHHCQFHPRLKFYYLHQLMIHRSI